MAVRLLKWLLAVALLAALALAAWDVATYDKAAWRADFSRLKRDMAQGYANLDWIATHRRLDVAALAGETEDRLDSAHSRLRAWFALKRFIDRFDDPHFRVEDHDPDVPYRGSVSPRPRPAGKDCAAAGYDEGEHAFRFPFEKLPGWRVLAEGAFPTGIADRTGVIRIAQLSEDRYLAACTLAFRPGLSKRALQLDTRRVLQGQLRKRIAALKAAGATRILVDLTGNGGGSEWVAEVVALFTPLRLERPAPRVVGPSCDRSAIWRGRPSPCEVFAPPRAGPARIRGTGEWRGTVLVLVDKDTASASEDFAGWIQDGGVGRILGARTAGAGCGYMDGGTRTSLKVLPVDVRMPNCARFMKNGLNEIEGIPPDIALPMEEPDKAADALARLLAGR
ncbi:MAG TPA: S41 family peptidase [Allosphingosinicella sp.]|nr:S41 family peptidase [Allosphingosinicella sp.]